MARPRQVTVDLSLTLIAPDPGLVVPARLRYSEADPFAMSLRFGLGRGDETVTWLFARDLLIAGISAPAGEGDVRIWPDQSGRKGTLAVQLSSPSGSATLAMGRDAAAAFLLSTYELVPPGAESERLDVDAALDSLLYPGLS